MSSSDIHPVEYISASRIFKRDNKKHCHFLLQWTNCDFQAWEKEKNILDPQLIKDFNEDNSQQVWQWEYKQDNKTWVTLDKECHLKLEEHFAHSPSKQNIQILCKQDTGNIYEYNFDSMTRCHSDTIQPIRRILLKQSTFSAPTTTTTSTSTSNTKKKDIISWEYLVMDGIDHKTNGWYKFSDDASNIVEIQYRNKNKFADVTSGGRFSYHVDFEAWTQTNIKTGKVRPIRRVVRTE